LEEAIKRGLLSHCIGILRAVGCNEAVINHCIAVADLALEIARRHHDGVDEKLVFAGALLHDMGRARSHGVDHGYVGGEMARALKMNEHLVRIIQRHVGAGITAVEAKELGLPSIDLMPETIEEKIVAHADNLIDGSRRTSIEDTIVNLKTKLGESHPSIERMRALHEEVMGEL
jgi:uncharacterized protein